MPSLWTTAVASAAACVIYSNGLGVVAFNLQTAPSKSSLGLGSVQSVQGLGLSSSSSPQAVSFGGRRSASVSQLHFPSAFAQGEGGSHGEDDYSAMAMASFIRCHKPLLNDRGPEIDGNLCMLLRGCDAHQRMISPLELKTNEHSLPGAAAAALMAAKGPAEAQALCEQQTDKLTQNASQCNGPRQVDLLKLEIGKIHRLLQYATAAGLKKNFLSQQALQVMLELYEEVGLDSEYILKVLRGLKDFYQAEMDDASFRGFFMPAYEEVILQFEEAKKLVRPAEKIPVASLPFEPTPDPRTVTPLLVDIMAFKDKLPNLKAWEGKQ